MKKRGKILVGNLFSETNEASINELFMKAEGTVVSVDFPLDKKRGTSRGYAFVLMSTQLEAEQAIEQLDGAEVGGRRVSLTLAEGEGVKDRRKWFHLF